MQTLYLQQHIVLKGFFIILVLFSCTLWTSLAQAQISLNGEQIGQLAKNGDISQAATSLAQQTNIPLNDATQLMQGLQGGNIDLGSSGNLLNGLIAGGQDNAGISNVIGMVQGLQGGQASPAAVAGLINQVTSGQISTSLANTLGQVSNLGNIQNINGVGALFQNSALQQQLQGLTGQGNLAQTIMNVAQVGISPQVLQQALTQMGAQGVAQTITNTLQQTAPQLSQALQQVSNLGGLLNNLGGAQIAQLAQIGNISQAVSALTQQINLPIGDVTQLLQGLQGGNIDLGSAGNLLNGIMSGQSGINVGNIGDVTSMLQGLQNGQANPAAIASLVSQVASGALPTGIAEALSVVTDLGNIQNIADVAKIFQNPAIQEQLQGLLAAAGLPEQAAQALQAIAGIASIGLDPQALQQAIAQGGIQAVAQTIGQALQQAAPQLSQALEQLFGGSDGLAGALGGLLSGAGIPDGNPGQPDSGVGCGACQCGDCAPKINTNHRRIRAHVTSEFEQHRNWIVTTYFLENIGKAMMVMTEQFAASMMQQVQIIGTFFDAKHQLETQRLFQQLTAKAHKDYHPSEGLCEIGTNIRSLAASERKTNLTHVAFANRMMQRQLSSGGNLATEGSKSDRKSRLKLFIKKFCNETDNGDGLSKVCAGGGQNREQINMDVDYTSAIENKLTLDVDFTEDGQGAATVDEENIFALSANLFGNQVLPIISDYSLADGNNVPSDIANLYLDIRAIAAKRSVAQNSFAAITALKTEGDGEAAPFLKAILAESGINPEEIEERLGKNPSYFAQMEVMTKDLYQNPTFYSNLYDKPTNINRKGAALQAIELMQDRDIYKSLMRSEAVLAVLLETLIRKEHDRVSGDLKGLNLEGETFKARSAGAQP